MLNQQNLTPKTNMISQKKILNTIFRLYDNCTAAKSEKTEYPNGGLN